MTAITAVIPTRNGGERLLRAVEALAQQTLSLAEIVVVDDASDDGSAAQLHERFPHVSLLQLEANAGPSAARNAGLRYARTDLVLLVDDDSHLARECVERLATAQREWGAAVACPRIWLYPERDIVQADGAEAHFVGTLALRNGFREKRELSSSQTSYIGAVPSGCLLVRR